MKLLNRKPIKLFMSVCLLLAVAFCAMPSVAHASTSKMENAYGSSLFDSEWEKTTTYYSGSVKIGIMIWGFDTDAIDEDYAWTMGYECDTTASIRRLYYDDSYIYGPEASKDNYSKLEITHETYDVNYRITFSATYADVTDRTEESNVKP